MKNKQAIGILDGGFEGLNIFMRLVKDYPYESFIYLNDPDNYPYEGKEERDIVKYIKKNVETLLDKNVKAILIVNNSIVEYGSEYLESLELPIYRFNEFIIDYVNEGYEHKNVGLLAKDYITKANIYQKKIKYNHLYSINSEVLDDIILNKEVKTAKSFKAVLDTFQTVKSKEYNVLVLADSYLNNLRLEFGEYVKCDEIIDVSSIVSKRMKDIVSNVGKIKKKGIILTKLSKEDFMKQAYWLDIKVKFMILE